MDRNDEIAALRRKLERLDSELSEARARLGALEQSCAREDPALLQDVAFAPEAATDAAEVPAPPAQEAPRPVAPPPLPWERPATTAAAPARPAERVKAPKPPWRFGPPADMDLETAIGTWWIPRIGVVVLSVGVVFLLTLAANTLMSGWMRPYLQVAGGYAVAIGLLFAARHQEKSARNFARVLASGGFALTYFVTFAAHFVVDPPVVRSELLTGLFLFAVVFAWTAVAQRRQSRLLGLGVTLLGHFTIFLSLRSAETGPLFSLVALLLFSLGSAFFLVRNRWYAVGAAGMVCTFLNLAALLDAQVFSYQTIAPAFAVVIVAMTYAIFALAELFAPEDLRRREVRLSLRSAYVTTNTLLALGLAVMLWNTRGLGGLPGVHVLYAAAGLLVLTIGRIYWHARRNDPLHAIYQIKGLSLITLALGKYLSGGNFVVVLALETLNLLVNARLTGFGATRLFSLLLAAFTGWMALIHTDVGLGTGPWTATWGPLVGSALLLNLAALLYGRWNWLEGGFDSGDAEKSALIGGLLRQMGLVKGAPDPAVALSTTDGPRQIAIWPLLYALAGTLPLLVYVNRWTPAVHSVPQEAILALVVILAGRALRAPSLYLQAPIFLIYAMYGAAVDISPTSDGVARPLLFLFAAALAAERAGAGEPLLAKLRQPGLAAVAALLAAEFLSVHWLPVHWRVAGTLVVVLAALGYAAFARLPELGATGILVALLVTWFAMIGDTYAPSLPAWSIPVITTGAAALFWFLTERALSRMPEPEWIRTQGTSIAAISGVLALLSALLLLRMLHQIEALSNFYLTIAWTLAAVALLLTGAATRQPFYRYAALGTFAVVTSRAALWDTRNLDLLPRTISWMLLGVVLLAVAYGYIRARGKKEPPQ